MAKKLSIGKIVLIGVGVVITLGSISALLHGRDEKEDEHVHDFGTSIVCECGEHKQEVLLSEVAEGMDLTGYSLRLLVSEEEFNTRLGTMEGLFKINFSKKVYVGEDERCAYITCDDINGVLGYWKPTAGSYEYVGLNLPGEAFGYIIGQDVDFGVVELVMGNNTVMNELIEFVYVGLPAPVEMVSAGSELYATNEADNSFFEEIEASTVVDDGDEWTRIF